MYREVEKNKILNIRTQLFNDPGYGEYNKVKYPFVLKNAELNLWEPIRQQAIEYFKDNKIQWHKGQHDKPTGHLISSQVSCINHLFFIRDKKELATVLLQNIDANIEEAEKIDDGYVEFEFIGKLPRLNEKSFKRGANCTSIDACMIGRYKNGNKILVFIEWKYTEQYTSQSKKCKTREDIYNPLITDIKSPFKDQRTEIYYFEPFYQLMRQTLLANKCIEYKDYECTSYKLVHIIPQNNTVLLNTITSPKMHGENISDAWKNTLKDPETYINLSPEKFLSVLNTYQSALQLINYLKKRYWVL